MRSSAPEMEFSLGAIAKSRCLFIINVEAVVQGLAISTRRRSKDG